MLHYSSLLSVTMSPSWEKNHLADLQSDLLDDDDEPLAMTFNERSTHLSPVHDASLLPPGPEAFPNHGPSFNGHWETEDFGESLESLNLSGNEGLSNSDISDSTSGRTNTIGMDANSSQYVPETISSTLNPGFANNRIYRAQTIHTASQTSNAAESSSSWRQPGHWSEGSSTNLQPPIWTPHNSSATTYSQYSESAGGIDTSTPCVEDYDLRPMPDDNAASMQSYNDPRTGIWAQEEPTMGMRRGSGINSTVTRLLPQNLQEIFANADAATPFGTESQSDECALFLNAASGADGGTGMAASSFPPLSTTGGPVPQILRLPSSGQSGVMIVINGTMYLADTSVQRTPGVEYSFLPPGSDLKSSPNMAPRILLDNPPLPTTALPPTFTINPPAPAPSPSVSADISTAGVARCTFIGCGAKFNGGSRKDSLRRHKRNRHGNKTKPTCPECHLVIQSGRPDNLTRHILRQHSGQPLAASLKVRTRKTGSKTAASKTMSRATCHANPPSASPVTRKED